MAEGKKEILMPVPCRKGELNYREDRFFVTPEEWFYVIGYDWFLNEHGEPTTVYLGRHRTVDEVIYLRQHGRGATIEHDD